MNGSDRMGKKIVIVCMFLIPLIALNLYQTFESKNQIRDIELLSSYMEFDYDSLKEEASTIALIKVNDDLNQHNSTIIYNELTGDISGFYGTRSVEVVEYFKNTSNFKDTLKIIEPAILTEDNEYIHTENYDKMEKDNYYIVFLSSDNASKELSIISANNGKIGVSNMEENEYTTIARKAENEFDVNRVMEEVENNDE